MSSEIEKTSASPAKTTKMTTSPRKRETFPHHLMTDFEKFVGHENFSYYIFMAFAVKCIHQCLVVESTANALQVSRLQMLGERSGEDALDQVVQFIQSRCISPYNQMHFISKIHYVPRNKYWHIDSLVDESIAILRHEFKRCMEWCGNSSSTLSNSPSRSLTKKAKGSPRKGRKGKSESIAVKYSKEQTDILNGWMIAHRKHPFPTSVEINELAEATHLTYSQIVNWTTNVRKRNLKATVEKGKKPHHFIDFLFLADSRDKKQTPDDTYSSSLTERTKNDTVKARTSANKRSGGKQLPGSHKYGGTKAKKLENPTNRHPNMKTTKMSIDSHLSSMTNWNVSAGSLPPLDPGHFLPTVTPPRMHPSSYLPSLEEYQDLPPVSDSLPNWQPEQGTITEDTRMLREITKDGLVATPPRRSSDGSSSIDLEDPRLLEKLKNIFQEREGTEPLELEGRPFNLEDIDGFMEPNVMEFDDDDLGESDVMGLIGDHIEL